MSSASTKHTLIAHARHPPLAQLAVRADAGSVRAELLRGGERHGGQNLVRSASSAGVVIAREVSGPHFRTSHRRPRGPRP